MILIRLFGGVIIFYGDNIVFLFSLILLFMTTYLSIDPAIKTLGIVKLKIDDKVNIIDFNLIDLCPKKKAKKEKFENLIKSLIRELDNIKIDKIDCIIIENIPSFKNPSIKSISVIIYTYFLLKKCNVKFVSPSKKLDKEKNKLLSYRERKQEGIKKCFDLISKEDKIKIMKYYKIDDITDCIIQAYEYHNK